MTKQQEAELRRELRALGLLPKVAAYFFLLFWNVVLSNLLVSAGCWNTASSWCGSRRFWTS